MRQWIKYLLLSVCGAVISACIVCAFIAGRKERGEIICKRIKVIVTDSTENRFISPEKIKRDLQKEHGKIIGLPIDSIDLHQVESIVDSKTAVYKSQAYTTKDSTLNIEISQRRPIVRFQKGSYGFYADKDGYIFPLQLSFTSHVLIIDGNIPINVNNVKNGTIKDAKERDWLLKTVGLVNFIENDKDWKRMIVQIHVNEDGDMILVPRDGQEQFLLGKPVDIQSKFEKIKKYYTAIIPKAGSEKYKVIDLRYRGQIICK